jgi:hypothetical protein
MHLPLGFKALPSFIRHKLTGKFISFFGLPTEFLITHDRKKKYSELKFSKYSPTSVIYLEVIYISCC